MQNLLKDIWHLYLNTWMTSMSSDAVICHFPWFLINIINTYLVKSLLRSKIYHFLSTNMRFIVGILLQIVQTQHEHKKTKCLEWFSYLVYKVIIFYISFIWNKIIIAHQIKTLTLCWLSKLDVFSGNGSGLKIQQKDDDRRERTLPNLDESESYY